MARAVAAYEDWGFTGLSREMIAVLNRWAAFLYGPLMDDRPRRLTEGMVDGHGREMAQNVFGELRRMGGVRPPREFVFMDRAAIGLGAVFIHLRASINWHRLFESLIEDFDVDALARRQQAALGGGGTVTAEGLKVSRSRHGPQETLDRLEVAIARYGMTIFARIDHGAAAEKAGLASASDGRRDLRQSARPARRSCKQTPTIAIDLPLKAVVWQDEAGVTWLGYNDPAWISRRHGVVDDGSVDVMIEALAAIANEATTT